MRSRRSRIRARARRSSRSSGDDGLSRIRAACARSDLRDAIDAALRRDHGHRLRLFFLLPSVAAVVIGIAVLARGTPAGDVLPGMGFALCAAALGILMTFAGISGLTTKIRITIEEESVRVEWRRFGRTKRQEIVARDELVDVGLDVQLRFRGEQAHRIVLGTKKGDVPIDDAQGGEREEHEREGRAVAAFLGVPVRG